MGGRRAIWCSFRRCPDPKPYTLNPCFLRLAGRCFAVCRFLVPGLTCVCVCVCVCVRVCVCVCVSLSGL
jgi:hypothetical protein